ncbi:hypothetical protein D3C72_2091160 [compost metagenome]
MTATSKAAALRAAREKENRLVRLCMKDSCNRPLKTAAWMQSTDLTKGMPKSAPY